MCKSFSGRGRISLNNEKNRFTYQAKIKDKKFDIGIDIPFKGQETLILPLVKPFKFEGSMYEKSINEIRKNKNNTFAEKLLKSFLFRTSNFISFAHRENDYACKGWQCLDGVFSQDGNDIVYEAALSKKYVYQAKLKNLRDGFYHTVSFSTFDIEKPEVSTLAMDLTVDECNAR